MPAENDSESISWFLMRRSSPAASRLRRERFEAGRTALRMATRKSIVELERREATSPEPHAVAIDGNTVYVSSRATRRIDTIDRDSWKRTGELDSPGMPWGMTFGDGALVMTCGETSEDTRRIRRYTKAAGFDASFVACPDDTGSHLAIYESRVLLGQWYNKKLLLLENDGSVARTYDAPHGIAGVAVVDGVACLLGTDDEEDGDYFISRVDLEDGNAEDLALVPFRARGLSYDGSRFWTNHREADRVVTFVLP
jgi:hypothetical protein